MPTPFVPVTNVLQVEFRYRVFSQNVENVMYFGSEDLEMVWDSAKADDLMDAIEVEWGVTYEPLVCTDVVLTELYCTDLSSETAPTYNKVLNLTGTHLGSSLPTGSTFTTTFVTQGRGRSSRGRNYWIALPENEVVGNQVDADYQGSILSWYGNLASTLQLLTPPIVQYVVSRFSEGAWRTNGLAQLVTAYRSADLNVDSQRRRLSGRGS